MSASLHALVLGIGLVTFGNAKPIEVPPTPSMPVDILSLSEFTQITRGQKTAPKAEAPKQIAEKVAEQAKPPETEAKKIAEKPPIETATAAPPSPPQPPQPPKVERPPEPPKAESKPPEPKREEPKVAEVPKPPERPRTPPPRPVERPQPAPQPPTQARAFDSNQIAALLDRREQTRAAATAPEVSRTAALGAPSGSAAALSQSEIDALRAQIQRCWNPPVGAADARDLVVQVRIALNVDGSLAGQPMVVNRGGSGFFQVASESALRAVRRCAPYTLPAAKYDAWRDVEITFDPRDMFRG